MGIREREKRVDIWRPVHWIFTFGQTEEGWHTVFTIGSVIYLSGATLYGLGASGDLQSWASSTPSVRSASLVRTDDCEWTSFLQETDEEN